MATRKLTPERRKEIFYAALDHTEGFRKSCDLTCKDVYVGFEGWLHRAIDDNWLIVAVTENAATALIESGFKMKLVQRAHKMRRLDRYAEMIALPREEQFDFFMRQDQVTLTTREENKKNGTSHWSEVLPLPEVIGRVGGTFRPYFTQPQKTAFVEHYQREPRKEQVERRQSVELKNMLDNGTVAAQPVMESGLVLVLPVHRAMQQGRSAYDATRGWWPNTGHWEHAKYAVGIVDRISVCVVEIERWLSRAEDKRRGFEGRCYTARDSHSLLNKDFSAIISSAEGYWRFGNWLAVEFINGQPELRRPRRGLDA